MTPTQFSKTELDDFHRALAPSIISLSQGGAAIGIVAEISRQLADDRAPGALFVPLEIALASRAQTTANFSAGGALVPTFTGATDPLPRAASVCLRAGAQLITGLKGDLRISRQTGGETLTWLHESDTVATTENTLGSLTLAPHRVSGTATISAQLETQSAGTASALVMDSLRAGLGAAIDRAALAGSGTAGEPCGLHSNGDVGTKTFGGAATWAILTDMQSTVAGNDANEDFTAWVAHPNVRERWRNIQRFSGSAKTLWHSDENTVAGNRAFVTTAAPATGVLCGDFSKLIVAFFGEAVTILPDPFTAKKTGEISYTIEAFADVGNLRPAMTIRNADSAVA